MPTTVGKTYLSLGLYPAAEPHLRRAVDIRREHLGQTHPDTLARAYFRTGDVGKAVEYGRQALSLLPDGNEERAEAEARLAEYDRAAGGTTS